jgi:hypothetical protein
MAGSISTSPPKTTNHHSQNQKGRASLRGLFREWFGNRYFVMISGPMKYVGRKVEIDGM